MCHSSRSVAVFLELKMKFLNQLRCQRAQKQFALAFRLERIVIVFMWKGKDYEVLETLGFDILHSYRIQVGTDR